MKQKKYTKNDNKQNQVLWRPVRDKGWRRNKLKINNTSRGRGNKMTDTTENKQIRNILQIFGRVDLET